MQDMNELRCGSHFTASIEPFSREEEAVPAEEGVSWEEDEPNSEETVPVMALPRVWPMATPVAV